MEEEVVPQEGGKVKVKLDEPVNVDWLLKLVMKGEPKTLKEPRENGAELLTEIEIGAKDYLNIIS